jgi:4-hydroxy-tetrahydrodipicolinate reductase
MADLGIGLAGCAGRMGLALVRRIAAGEGCRLVGALERPGHEALGTVGDDAAALFAECEVVIEFSAPEATAAHAALARASATAHVIGTTGLDEAQGQAVRAAGKRAAVVWAPNMSAGINLLLALAERTARVLDADYDIEIVEMHHRHKADAPSGTALGLGRAAAAGRGVELDEVAARARDGVTGPRRRGDIGFAVVRGGDVVGDHTVVFAAEGERIELGHRASSRDIYAGGAVRAALWTRGRAPGLYGMREVLGLE